MPHNPSPPLSPQPSTNDKPTTPPTFNYKAFREEQCEPLGELWDDSVSLADNFMRLARESVIIPYCDIQLPILTAFAFTPSAMASIVPILVLQGDKGSGKSTITTLISELHKSEIKSAATTFAGLRNFFNKLRWTVPDELEIEKNCCLLFDNVNRETLLNEQLYTMLLNGYNRKTDTISISKGNGENIDFKVFGLKVMSTIHPFYIQSKFSELSRRCVVIKFKPFEQMTLTEKQSSGIDENYNIVERLELDNLDLSILHKEFIKFWEREENLIEYTTLKRQLMSRRKKFVIPEVIDGSKWTISIDLIVTGIVTGIWDSIPIAIEAVASYWQWHKHNVASAFGATHKILRDFIEDETAATNRANKELGFEAIRRQVSPEKLKKHITWASNQGMLDITPNPNTISQIMADLGWRLDKGDTGEIVWLPALN